MVRLRPSARVLKAISFTDISKFSRITSPTNSDVGLQQRYSKVAVSFQLRKGNVAAGLQQRCKGVAKGLQKDHRWVFVPSSSISFATVAVVAADTLLDLFLSISSPGERLLLVFAFFLFLGVSFSFSS
jgi:hypothetical protein